MTRKPKYDNISVIFMCIFPCSWLDRTSRDCSFSLQNRHPRKIQTDAKPKGYLTWQIRRGWETIHLLTVHRAVNEISLRASSDPMQISTTRETGRLRRPRWFVELLFLQCLHNVRNNVVPSLTKMVKV